MFPNEGNDQIETDPNQEIDVSSEIKGDEINLTQKNQINEKEKVKSMEKNKKKAKANLDDNTLSFNELMESVFGQRKREYLYSPPILRSGI